VTLWRDHFVPEDYRRLNILVNWLLRGQS
jgi:hypothetical protein